MLLPRWFRWPALWWAGLLTVSAVVAVIGSQVPAGVAHRGPLGVLMQERFRADRLEAKRCESLYHYQCHQAILHAVADGRLPFAQAVASFQATLEAWGLGAHVRANYSGRTDEEKFAAALMDHLKRDLSKEPTWPALSQRLQADSDAWHRSRSRSQGPRPARLPLPAPAGLADPQ